MNEEAYLSLHFRMSSVEAFLFVKQHSVFELRHTAQAQLDLNDSLNTRQACVGLMSRLQAQSAYRLLDSHGQIRSAVALQGEGVRGTSICLSLDRPIRGLLVGVSEQHSLDSLRRLVSLFDVQICGTVFLQEALTPTQSLNRILATDASLIVMAGGVEGSDPSKLKAMVEQLRIAYHHVPHKNHPQLLYCGNSALHDYVLAELDAGEDLHLAGNILPEIGREDLPLAWPSLLDAWRCVRLREFPALYALAGTLSAKVYPGGFAAGRILRLLDGAGHKGVLSLRLEENRTEILATRRGKFFSFQHSLYPTAEMIAQAEQSLSQDVPTDDLATYLNNRMLFPGFLPTTLEEVAMEEAWVRVRIQQALAGMHKLYPQFPYSPELGLKPSFEPILLAGSAFSQTVSAQHALLVALDSFMPHGISTIALDSYDLMPILGSLADYSPELVVQMLDQDVFESLATVVCVDSPEETGLPLLKLELESDTPGPHSTMSVLQSELKPMRVTNEASTRIYLKPSELSDIGMGLPGRGGWVTVAPAALGVVVDARGRPLPGVTDPAKRAMRLRDWLWELGG